MDTQNIFSLKWEDLNWSEWVPLKERGSEFRKITDLPGVYRVRAKDIPYLLYIGQTGRSVRKRLSMLSVNAYQLEMPFDDPHTAAPNLWAYLNENNYEYECSGAAATEDKRERMGLEDYLLWKHRDVTGFSTLCNYGRFHKAYTKSKNRKSGIRGSKLSDGEENSASGPSYTPKILSGEPIDLDWMGFDWDIVKKQNQVLKVMRSCPCVYKLVDRNINEVLYIGQTGNCKSRLNGHLKIQQAIINQHFLEIHVAELGEDILTHQLHEIESDLLGAYFHLKKTAPKYQYRGGSL